MTSSYIIQATNGSLKYWVQIEGIYKRGSMPEWRLNGLKDNAYEFKDVGEAREFRNSAQRSVSLTLKIVDKYGKVVE